MTVTSVLRKCCGVPYCECVVGSGEVGGVVHCVITSDITLEPTVCLSFI